MQEQENRWWIAGVLGAGFLGWMGYRYVKRKSQQGRLPQQLPGTAQAGNLYSQDALFKAMHSKPPQVAMGSWPTPQRGNVQMGMRTEGGIPVVPLPSESAARTRQAWPTRYGQQPQQQVEEVQLATPQGRQESSGVNGTSYQAPPPVERFGGDSHGDLGGETF